MSEQRCKNCGAAEIAHYDGVQCPVGAGTYSATSRFAVSTAMPWDMPTADRAVYEVIASTEPEGRGPVMTFAKKYADLLFAEIEARDVTNKRIAKLEADLQAMTEDRNLWRDEHEGDCPVVSERDAAREQLAIAERALLNQFVCAEDPKNLFGLAILEAAEQSKAEKERAQ